MRHEYYTCDKCHREFDEDQIIKIKADSYKQPNPDNIYDFENRKEEHVADLCEYCYNTLSEVVSKNYEVANVVIDKDIVLLSMDFDLLLNTAFAGSKIYNGKYTCKYNIAGQYSSLTPRLIEKTFIDRLTAIICDNIKPVEDYLSNSYMHYYIDNNKVYNSLLQVLDDGDLYKKHNGNVSISIYAHTNYIELLFISNASSKVIEHTIIDYNKEERKNESM